MALVIIAAFLQAILFLLFRLFEKRGIALMPGIAVNYVVAMCCGLIYAPPWSAGDISGLWWPSAGIAVLFVAVFFLTGLSAQRAGVAASSVASKMSVILTVLFSVVVHHERPGLLGWTGLLFAVAGVVLASWTTGVPGTRKQWWLPLLLFVGTACIDIAINTVQRTLLTPSTEAVFPTMGLGIAGLFATITVLRGNEAGALRNARTWIGGTLLGIVNYGSLLFVVKALAHSGLQASSVFPLISIFVILFGTLGSIALFGERLRRVQYAGIALAVVALVLLMTARA
jgi:drug/metabolite transporter (DMT)-like permease